MNGDLTSGVQIGPPSNPIIIRVTEFEGHRLLDIRKYFIESGSKQLKPTRKGISLNARAFSEIAELLRELGSEIRAWLEQRSRDTKSTVVSDMQARADANESEARRARQYTVHLDSWKGAEFFVSESHGHEDKISLNGAHPFFHNTIGDEMENVSRLLASYHRTKLRFSGELNVHSEDFFRMFEHEWGLLLRNYEESENARATHEYGLDISR